MPIGGAFSSDANYPIKRWFFETPICDVQVSHFLVKRVSFTHLENQSTVNSLENGVLETPAVQKNRKPKRLVGYARVSTSDQELNLQLDALQNHGCDPNLIFVDRASGTKSERPGLTDCLATLQKADVLVVWRLDRLGRSMPHLVSIVDDLNKLGVGFRSLSDGGSIDTTTASGQLIFNVFAAMAAFERALIVERTNAGLAAARARGRVGGRPRLKATDNRVRMAKSLHKDQSLSISEICETMGVSKATLYRYLAMS